MKTQVIQLDPHDDVTSIRDKISWAKAARILLVYPPRSQPLRRELDLRLLQRHALTLGAQLAIVSPSEEIRSSIQELGIPVFKTVMVAQREMWDDSFAAKMPVRRAPAPDLRQMRREVFPPEARWRTRLGFRLLFFGLGVVAVLSLVLLFIPSATIELMPVTHLQSLAISASASPKATTVSLVGSLPARLTFMVFEKSKTTRVTGSKITPKTTAGGTVQFRNLTTSVTGVPAGTVVRTTGSPSIRFATRIDAVIPAGNGKTLDVPIDALEPGSSGNLLAGSLVAIEGELGASLAVSNPDPTSGGTDSSAPVQTAGDRASLHDALVAMILAQCKTSLPASLAPGDVFFQDTLSTGQILSETYFPADGQTGETLSLTMNLQCQAQYASAADVIRLASLALDANLPDDFEIIPGIAGPINTSGVPRTSVDGSTHWEIKTLRLLQSRLDPVMVVELARGRRPAKAASRLKDSFKLGASPKIGLTPYWWPWLPVIPFRISVQIDRPLVTSE